MCPFCYNRPTHYIHRAENFGNEWGQTATNIVNKDTPSTIKTNVNTTLYKRNMWLK